MCGIAGVISINKKEEVGKLLKNMLTSMQHRGPDGAGFCIDGIVERKDTLDQLNFAKKKGYIALGHVRLAITGGMTYGIQPFLSEDGKLCVLHNGEIYNYRKLKSELENDFTFKTESDSEVILKLIEKEYKGDLLAAVRQVLPKLDGVYALVVSDNQDTIIARDKIGVRQFYFYTANDKVAFASEKKPLLALSAANRDIQRLLPGHLAVINKNGLETIRFWTPDSLRPENRITEKEKAFHDYDNIITEAVRKRIVGQKRVGIIFSGGIDSVLIAYIAKKLGHPFMCYTAGREGATDIENSIKIARQLGLPLKFKILTNDDIRELIPQIMVAIEDHSMNQVEVAVPIYASIQMAHDAGERVVLTGQGADELFGGYSWYSKIVDQEGYELFEKYSWEDTFLLYKECLEREDKISMTHSLELRVPFLDPEVIKLAFQLAPELKINPGDDQLRKRIHREFCLRLGIPEEIAFREKEAAQHGADIHDALVELADQIEIQENTLEKAGYDIERSVTEKLGSSSRYGYHYGDQHLWEPLPKLQYYLDCQAVKVNMLPEKAKDMLVQTIKNLNMQP